MSRVLHPINLGLHILHSASPLGLFMFWCHHNSIKEPSTADGKKKWKPASSTHASHLEHKSLYQPPFTRNSTREANKVYSAAYPLIFCLPAGFSPPLWLESSLFFSSLCSTCDSLPMLSMIFPQRAFLNPHLELLLPSLVLT